MKKVLGNSTYTAHHAVPTDVGAKYMLAKHLQFTFSICRTIFSKLTLFAL